MQMADTFVPTNIADSLDERVLGVGVRRIALHRAAPAICPIGALVVISSEPGGCGMLRPEWHQLERWGCWSSGSPASMQLSFDAPLDSSYTLEFDPAPPLLDMSVTLAVNDTVLDTLHAIDAPNRWIVPPSCTAS